MRLNAVRTAFAALLCTCFLSLAICASAQKERPVRRAAFDIGSAAIKCKIADINPDTGAIVNTVAEYSVKVDFAESLARSYDKNLPKEIQDKGIKVLKELKSKAMEFEVEAYSAVGGTAFRDARNGRAYFVRIKSETGIPSRVVSKQQTALLSFYAAGQQMDTTTRPILVWDIGGSSMQMTARNMDGSLTFYIDPMASVPFKNVVIGVIQDKNINTTSTPNPIDEAQVDQAYAYAKEYAQSHVLPDLASRIQRENMRIVGIGGVHYYAVPEMIGARDKEYTRTQIEEAVTRWTGKPDEDFKSEYAASRLSNLILVKGYMDALSIDAVSPLKINQTDGLLAAPEFW